MVKNILTIEQQAMAYHVNGYNLIPIKKDKTPNLGKGEVVPQRTADQTDEQILAWFKNGKNNIGIITGKKSNLIVIDIDTYAGGVDIFPATYTVKTGNGGLQKYYQYTEGFTISASGYPNMPHIDIRADGGYVVAAPSVTDYIKDGKKAGGLYTVIDSQPLQPFPAHLFPKTKPKKTLTEVTTASKGSRNDNLTSFTGSLLASRPESEWLTEVLPVVERTNKTYAQPLPDDEVLTLFNSIMKKEKTRRLSLTTSPVIIDSNPTGETMNVIKSRSGIPFMNMSNVVAILEAHPDFRNKIRYNLFRQEIEIDGVPIEDNDIMKLQYVLQTKFGLHSINKDAVFSALMHCAYDNAYDEAQDWLKSLVWDTTPRLQNWLSEATGVPNDEYHQGIGSQWLMGIIKRIMIPGCIFDYMIVLVGPQGIGKTSLFRIIGGKWYKSYTGAVDTKDFFLTLRGAIIMDLDEGAAMYHSDAIKLKSIITQTHDEFRAPYDRVPKKFPRRFVFSMSTNDSEPFRDVTGNRRYWVVDAEHGINFKWLEENRDQLYAETYHYFKNEIAVSEVPMEEARERQEAHLPSDAWTDLVCDEVRKSYDYCCGDPEYSTTVIEIFSKIFQDESMIRLDKKYEMRIGNIFRQELGLVKIRKMIEGEQKNRWYISESKMKELQKRHAKKTKPDDFEQLSGELMPEQEANKLFNG